MPAWRQWRGQVHPDQDFGRASTVRPAANILSKASQVVLRQSARRARCRDRDRLSGSRDDPADVDHPQFLHGAGAGGRRSAVPANRFQIRPSTSRGRRCTGSGIDVRDPHQAVGTLRAASANVCDRTGGLFRREGAHPRRADLGAWRRPDLDGAQVHPSSSGRRGSASSSSPTTCATPMPPAIASPC